MIDQKTIGVIIPCYNVQNLIAQTIRDLPDFIDKIFIIDDCSQDETASTVTSLNNEKVTLLQHPENRGLGGTLITGYKRASDENMDIVVKVDGDGQMPPEYIEPLIQPLLKGEAGYTKGDRLSVPEYRKSMPKFRLFGNFCLTLLTRIASGYWHVSDPQNGFTAITWEALQKLDVSNLYTYYGVGNDILVRLKIAGIVVQDIPMPSRYGKEKSSIRYSSYIPKVSFMLLRKFIWRLLKQYIIR